MKALFSPCMRYRYTLWREWGELFAVGKYVNFICLNPSTADDDKDDNTIRKCIKFAKSWGYDGLCVTNLFAWRSTDPKVLKHAVDPIGPENDIWIEDVAKIAELVVAAWSQHGSLHGRSSIVRAMIRQPIHYLKMSAEPHHPLYLPDSTRPTLWPRMTTEQTESL